MKNMILILVLLSLAALPFACDIVQTTTPSSVDVTVTNPTETTATTGTPTEPKGTITLEPPSVQLEVGENANVKVVVKDENSVEVPSENISVNIIDKTILALVEIDGRIIAFQGVSAGVTSVIISASGLQTSLVATVTP